MKLDVFVGTEHHRDLLAKVKKSLPGHFHLYDSLLGPPGWHKKHSAPEELQEYMSQQFLRFGWDGIKPICLYGRYLEELRSELASAFQVTWITRLPTMGTASQKLYLAKEGPYRLDSFCTVATKEMKREVLLTISTVRLFHAQPIYVLCDTETQDYLSSKGLSNVHTRVGLDPVNLREARDFMDGRVEDKTKFHRSDVILKKMDVMDWAMEDNSSTMFLDADIVLVAPLQETYDTELVLSPHYHNDRDNSRDILYGKYNAGYVFCANKSFPQYWVDLYLNRSTFFEQQCMDYFPIDYATSIYGDNHNIGIWRAKGTIPKLEEEPISFHCHLEPRLDYRGGEFIRNRCVRLSSRIVEYLVEKEREDVLAVIPQEFLWGVIKTMIEEKKTCKK